MGLRDEGGAAKEVPPQPTPAPQPAASPKKGKSHQSPRKGPTNRSGPPAKIVHVDKRCLSCSGQAPSILSAFKMACLQYNPSPVKYENDELPRADILHMIEARLTKAHFMYRSGPTNEREASYSGFSEPARPAAHTISANAYNMMQPGSSYPAPAGQLSLANYMPLAPGQYHQESNSPRKTSSRGNPVLPTLHTSRPNSKPGTPREVVRDSLKDLKSDMIE